MKPSTWQECIETNNCTIITKDNQKSKSLLETAKERMKYLKEQTIKEQNANYIFEGYYSSLLENLHAILTSTGYKSENHLCLGFYLRDKIKREDLFRTFDDCRYKRNSLVYYGKRMDYNTAKEAITKCIKLINELQLIHEKEK